MLVKGLFNGILCVIAVNIVVVQCSNSNSGGGLTRPELYPPPFRFKDDGDRVLLSRQEQNCETPQNIVDEIKGYASITQQIMDEVLTGSFKGRTYKKLADFVDKFGTRLSGTQTLEDSIDYMLDDMRDIGLENVAGEQVLVGHWVRGEERAELISPRRKNLALLGVGNSVGTPPEGITAEVLVVRTFEELTTNAALARGKIVVYNNAWMGSYGQSVSYRTQGANRASEVGAVASLIRSIAPFSLDTPHTGGQDYADGVNHIPTACITHEDAELLYRLQSRGERLVINLKMQDYNLPLTTSRNAVGEIVGREFPNQVVAVSGHIDSWDVGQGAMDDAGGVFISTEALALIKHLNLPQPRRTLRAILWTSEEAGLMGAADYAKQHKDELKDWSVAFESDSGTLKPRGLDFAGTPEAGCIVQEVLKLLEPIDVTTYARYDFVSSDITVLIAEGVPGLSLDCFADEFFWSHHTEADTISLHDPDELDLDLIVWAVSSYVLADLTIPLPRNTD